MKFQRGQTDEFRVVTWGVREIKAVRLGVHAGRDEFKGWFVDWVKIHLVETPHVEPTFFPCYRWIEPHHDGALCIEIAASTRLETTYELIVTTANGRNASTTADVFVEIHGSAGSSGIRRLESSLNHNSMFERAQTDTFHIHCVSLGDIERVRLSIDAHTLPGQGWHLAEVKLRERVSLGVTIELAPKNIVFDVGRRTTYHDFTPAVSIADNKQLSAPQHVGTVNVEASRAATTYNVEVKTGSCAGAGTTADVWIEVVGESGSTELLLEQSITNKVWRRG